MKKNVRVKKKPPPEPSGSVFKLGRKRFFVWAGITFFAMVWMFVLGILVGRGLSPVRFDVPKLKGDLATLKEKVLPTDQAGTEEGDETISEDPDLDFYKALREKQEEPRSRIAEVPRKTAVPKRQVAKAKEEPPKVVEEPEKEPAKPKAVSEVASEPHKAEPAGRFTIQVAAFKRVEKARELVDRLRRKGYDAYEVTASLSKKGTYHRVRVGRFANEKEAKLTASSLRKERLETIIVKGD